MNATPEVPTQPEIEVTAIGQLEKSTASVQRVILNELAKLPYEERSALLVGVMIRCQERWAAMNTPKAPLIVTPEQHNLIVVPGR